MRDVEDERVPAPGGQEASFAAQPVPGEIERQERDRRGRGRDQHEAQRHAVLADGYPPRGQDARDEHQHGGDEEPPAVLPLVPVGEDRGDDQQQAPRERPLQAGVRGRHHLREPERVEQPLVGGQSRDGERQAGRGREEQGRQREDDGGSDGLQRAPRHAAAAQAEPPFADGEQGAQADQRERAHHGVLDGAPAAVAAEPAAHRAGKREADGEDEGRRDEIDHRDPDVGRVLQPAGHRADVLEEVREHHHEDREAAEPVDGRVAGGRDRRHPCRRRYPDAGHPARKRDRRRLYARPRLTRALNAPTLCSDAHRRPAAPSRNPRSGASDRGGEPSPVPVVHEGRLPARSAEEADRALAEIEIHGDRRAWAEARELRAWLSRTTSAAS